MPPKQKLKQKKINLALQGGGSHGAFAWGVLDYILENGRLDIEAITATSAGAMNAAMLAQGLAKGGAKGARDLLEKFWKKISQTGFAFNPAQNNPLQKWASSNPFLKYVQDGQQVWMDTFSHFASPYQFNPANYNPLRDILSGLLDEKKLHACREVKLFITATHVQTGAAKIFQNDEISIDVLCASAALPTLFHAVEINGEHYWDGGYVGNPSLWPLFYRAVTRDILIVHINPIRRDEIPKDSASIENRLNEITFNNSLLKELRAISFVQKLIEEDMLKPAAKKNYKNMLLHAIRSDALLNDLDAYSKFDTSWAFLTGLRDLGRTAAKNWIDHHYDDIGVASTIDIQKDYLSIGRQLNKSA